MDKNETISIRELIRKIYPQDKRNFDSTALLLPLIRRISFYPTWLFIKIGVSANTVSFISLIFGLTGCLFLTGGDYISSVTGAILLNLWFLLDCVDGNIARYNTPTRYGKFLDVIVGTILSGFILSCWGMGVYRNPDTALSYLFPYLWIDRSVYLVAGFLSSILLVLIMAVHSQFTTIFLISKAPDDQKGFFEKELSKGWYSILYLIGWNIINFPGVVLILLVSVIFKLSTVAIIFLFLCYSLAFIVLTAGYIRKAKRDTESGG